ncbi:MAG TPA: SDR family oxidoreductase [Chitinophagales bacterium]|nr:SDR family oxidoreductase [Chitinophagales bacterium]
MNLGIYLNKKCLVTGAASGIGRSVALLLGKYGAELFLTDIDEAKLQQTENDIINQNGKVSYSKAFDIRDYDAVKIFSDEIQNSFGAMDMVMNIAGVAIWGEVGKMPHEDWKKIIDVNLMGPIHIIECFIPAMMKNGYGGNLVNVSSAAGLFGLPWHGAYSASKFGLRGLSDVLRHDLKRNKIRVHLVCPGAVDTGLVDTIKISGMEITDDQFSVLKKRFQGRAVSPDEAAASILKGVENKEYLIFTSTDIKFGHWGQRKFTFIYDWIMQKMNVLFQKALTGQ